MPQDLSVRVLCVSPQVGSVQTTTTENTDIKTALKDCMYYMYSSTTAILDIGAG